MKFRDYELSGAKGSFEQLLDDDEYLEFDDTHNEHFAEAHCNVAKQSIIYPKQYHDIVVKYYELAKLKPDNKCWYDIVAYIYVKIMFEHPLVDGNKRLAMGVLLTGLDIAVHFADIEAMCKSLAKEVQ